MTGESSIVESSAPTVEDARQRTLVEGLIKTENAAIGGFAKQLVTISFSAIGVVLTLKEKWLGAASDGLPKTLLGLAIVLFLAAGALAAFTTGAFAHKVTLADFSQVEAELRRVARKRHRFVTTGFVLSLLATALVAYVAISF